MDENIENILNKPISLIKNQHQTFSGDNSSIRRILKISEEDVRNRAYRLFMERGQQTDLAEEDWYRAEEELIREKIKKRENIIRKVFVCQMN